MMTSERQSFEEWSSKHWRLCGHGFDRNPHQFEEYSEPEMQDAWEIWQERASRDSCGKELAELVTEICGNPNGISESRQDILYETALSFLKEWKHKA